MGPKIYPPFPSGRFAAAVDRAIKLPIVLDMGTALLGRGAKNEASITYSWLRSYRPPLKIKGSLFPHLFLFWGVKGHLRMCVFIVLAET